MASDTGPTATESSLVTAATTASPTSAALPRTSSPRSVATDARAPPNTKRPREESPISPTSPASARISRDYSPSKVARLGLSAQLSPPFPLTGAAAVEEERRRREEERRRNPPGVSENPNHKALSDLMSGGALTVSRPQDAPSPLDEIALAAEATKALHPVTIPQPNVSDARTDISPPHSASSTAAAADSRALMNSPGPMDVDERSDRQSYASQPEAQMDDKTATSLSYPGVLPHGSAAQTPVPPPRPSSLPHNSEHTPTSSKRHKCPYCETEFTRHHNLKSHLLTHSQEKPYLCKDCNLRFRRLHDLKRHGKLHTGEKNHECPKCGRKFARGDALARHSKGAGGCAGRRASMGSYGEQGDYDGASRNEGDDAMAGVVYDDAGDVDMTEEERRRQSLPAIKAHHAPASESVGPTSRTYPPAAGVRAGAPAVLYPPNNSSPAAPSSLANNVAGGRTLSSSAASCFPSHDPLKQVNSNGSSPLHLQGITESPKPLSPAVHDQARQRSPGLAPQYQHQQQYTRRPSDRDIQPLPSLPPPPSTINPLVHVIRLHQPTNGQQGQPPPPALAASTQAHSRVSNGPASHPNSGDSNANLFAQGDQGVWAYMQQLEERVKDLSERLASVENVSNAREARLASVESTLTHRDSKIGFMELEISGLRKELAETRQYNDGPAQAA